jgi:hypothetical protein
VRLVLELPPEWTVTHHGGQQIVIIPGGAQPDLILAYIPLIPMQHDDAAWRSAALHVDCDATHRLEVAETESRRTLAGWPMKTTFAKVFRRDENGEQLEEVRLAAFYYFMEHRAVAMVRSINPQRFEAHRSLLLEIMESGRPDFRGDGEVSCVDELYEPLTDLP